MIAVGIGVAIAMTSYTLTALLADVPFSVGGLAKSAVIGAASAAVTFGIGSAASTITNFYVRAAVSAVAHGTFQGGMTAIQGGKFWSEFASGALSSIAASAWSGGDTITDNGDYTMSMTTHAGLGAGTGDLGMVAFGSITGGASATLTGGNFWQGAVAGLVISGLNHAIHSMMQEDPNRVLAKRIASEYGYDWKEVEAFLDENPFILTHKGVAMGSEEALSSKFIEDDKTVVDYVQDQVQSEIQSRIIEYLSPRAGKILGLGSELLSSQTAHAPDANYLVKQNQELKLQKQF